MSDINLLSQCRKSSLHYLLCNDRYLNISALLCGLCYTLLIQSRKGNHFLPPVCWCVTCFHSCYKLSMTYIGKHSMMLCTSHDWAVICHIFCPCSAPGTWQWSSWYIHCISRTSHCPIAYRASNAPNPSEYLPSNLSPTTPGGLSLQALQRHHVPKILYFSAGGQVPIAWLSMPCCPIALACAHSRDNFPAWLTSVDQLWPCSLETLCAIKKTLTQPSTRNWNLGKGVPFQVCPSSNLRYFT